MPDRSDNLHCLSFQNLQTELKNLFWNSSKCILKICQLLPEKSKILDFMMTSSLFGDHFGKLFLVILFFLLQRTYVPIFIIISLMVQILGRGGGKFTPPMLKCYPRPPMHNRVNRTSFSRADFCLCSNSILYSLPLSVGFLIRTVSM